MIEVLVGMIGSGKSTYAAGRAREGAFVVCRDDLTAMLHGRHHYESRYGPAYHDVEEAVVRAALAHSIPVVVDRTNLTRAARARWVGLAGATGDRVVAVVFPPGPAEVHARRRFEADPRGQSFEQWLAVANRQLGESWNNPVTDGEDFDEVRPVGEPPERHPYEAVLMQAAERIWQRR